jgi:putative acetyltransferase
VSPFKLRPYGPSDEPAAIELWRRSWQVAYPSIDFSARLTWWRERWRNELAPAAQIIVAQSGQELIGFVTIDAQGYLDQLVVSPEQWGGAVAGALVSEAKVRSPSGIDLLVNADNGRAIAFYRKQGFSITGEEVNPRSGAPVHRMSWRS